MIMKTLHLPKLNEHQLEKLSDIASDSGLVALASVVLPAILDKFNPILVVSGIVTTGGFWIFSIWLRR